MKLPNLITSLRLVLIPAFLLPLTAEPPMFILSLSVFLVAAVSDAVDGAVARKTGTVTHAGSFLDPMADKLLIVSGFAALTVLGIIPLWLTIMVFMRDLIIFLGWFAIFAYTGEKTISPSKVSKATTFLQMGVIAAALGGLKAGPVLFPVAGLFTVISGLNYITRGTVALKKGKQAG